jgi:uncharacterized repeat protein (TIGR03803 family)
MVFVLAWSVALPAQSYSVIHYFTGAGDGYYPWGLTIDQAGNLYGATLSGGPSGQGEIFRMARRGSGWTLTPLYHLGGLGVVFGPDGKLYGTGGGALGLGGVFSLAPPASACATVLCPWTATILHSFAGGPDDGAGPANADLVFDQQGNIYGTTSAGGSGACSGGCGTVYRLSHDNGGWSSSVLYSFQGYSPDDFSPFGGVIFDQAGNLYGTAQGGPLNAGTVYQLTPNNGSWSKSTIYEFDAGNNQGFEPYASLLLGPSGAMYGTTQAGGEGQNGTAFELTPSNGGWNFTLLYSLSGPNTNAGSEAPLTQDAAGNLYGTTTDAGAYGYGNVFKLTYTNGSWIYSSLHDFQRSDGWGPQSKVVIDAQGHLYGTTINGGPENPACGGSGATCGVVWEIVP